MFLFRPRIGVDRPFVGIEGRAPTIFDRVGFEKPGSAEVGDSRRVVQPAAEPHHGLLVSDPSQLRQETLDARLCELLREGGLIQVVLELAKPLLGG